MHPKDNLNVFLMKLSSPPQSSRISPLVFIRKNGTTACKPRYMSNFDIFPFLEVCLTPEGLENLSGKGEYIQMAEHCEVKSENARNVILSYGENVYFVSQVNVRISEGEEKLKATFHARRLPGNEPEDLHIEINQRLYDALLEYTKMDKYDLILVLQIQDGDARWCLMSEKWFKNQAATPAKTKYIV